MPQRLDHGDPADHRERRRHDQAVEHRAEHAPALAVGRRVTEQGDDRTQQTVAVSAASAVTVSSKSRTPLAPPTRRPIHSADSPLTATTIAAATAVRARSRLRRPSSHFARMRPITEGSRPRQAPPLPRSYAPVGGAKYGFRDHEAGGRPELRRVEAGARRAPRVTLVREDARDGGAGPRRVGQASVRGTAPCDGVVRAPARPDGVQRILGGGRRRAGVSRFELHADADELVLVRSGRLLPQGGVSGGGPGGSRPNPCRAP